MNKVKNTVEKMDEALFGVKENKEVVYSTLKWFLSSKRAGTHSTLTRSEVSGGGKKPWKQKGTGRARAGTIRSPLWRHGAVLFGPKPRDYSYNLPKKIRKLALKVVLSDRAREGKIKIVDSFDVKAPKTKEIISILKDLGVFGTKTLVVLDKISKELSLASRNVKGLTVSSCQAMNIFDLLNSENLILTKDAVSKLTELLV